MKGLKLTVTLSLLSLLLSSLLGCSGSTAVETAPIVNEVNTNQLLVEKTENSGAETLLMQESCKEIEDGKEKFCLCRAVAFRIAQICSQLWDDGVFRSYEVEGITTGWNTPGPQEMFVEVLGIASNKVTIPDDATPYEDLPLNDSWYKVEFKNGRELLFKGTDKIYGDKFLALRKAFKNGDKSVETELKTERNTVQQSLTGLPFKDKFIIEEE
jgi:hypothetical protein